MRHVGNAKLGKVQRRMIMAFGCVDEGRGLDENAWRVASLDSLTTRVVKRVGGNQSLISVS